MDPSNNYGYGSRLSSWHLAPNWPGPEWFSILLSFRIERGSNYHAVAVENPGYRGKALGNPYSFGIDAEGGGIILQYRFKNRDMGSPREEKTSEIVWRCWFEETIRAILNANAKLPDERSKVAWAANHGADSLKYIISETVVNRETQEIADEAFNKLGYGRHVASVWIASFDPETGDERQQVGYLLRVHASDPDPVAQEVFNAILGSRNMKGPARMLLDHSKALKGKQVMEISVFWPTRDEAQFDLEKPSIGFKLDWPPSDYFVPRLRTRKSRGRKKKGSTHSGTRRDIDRARDVSSLRNGTSHIPYKRSHLIRRYPQKSRRERILAPRGSSSKVSGKGPLTDDQRRDAARIQRVASKISMRGYSPRDWDVIWAKGNEIRDMKPRSGQDVSEAGSTIIINENNNYLIKRNTKDPITQFDHSPWHNYLDVDDAQCIEVTNVKVGFGIPELEEYDLSAANLDSPYSFAISKKQGALAIDLAFKSLDAGKPREEKFSEIMYRVWHDYGAKTSSLEYVIIADLINLEFREYIKPAFAYMEAQNRLTRLTDKAYWNIALKELHVRWADHDRESYAIFNFLVACQVAAPISRMLSDHWHALGGKEIVEVRVSYLELADTYYIGFKLGHISEKEKMELEGKRKNELAKPVSLEELDPDLTEQPEWDESDEDWEVSDEGNDAEDNQNIDSDWDSWADDSSEYEEEDDE
ncbi:hypothetical protein TWF696_003760 [Orbilia brochopaga]|uniref:Uncharacterized protein n=1 Tax=Orbilia brochopaga TaxID=3140254 RepID=A0AAV9V5A5_9PEZI